MTAIDSQTELSDLTIYENHLASVRSNSSKGASNGSSDKDQWLVVQGTSNSLYALPEHGSGVLNGRPSHILTTQEASLTERPPLSQTANNKDDEINPLSALPEHIGTEVEEDIMWNQTETTLLLNYINDNYGNWFSGNKTKFYKQFITDVLKNRNPTQVKNKVHKLLAKYHKIRSQKNSGGTSPNWAWYTRMDQVFGQRGHTPSTNITGEPKSGNPGVDSSDDSEENKRPTKRKKRVVTTSAPITPRNTTNNLPTANSAPVISTNAHNISPINSFIPQTSNWVEKYWEGKLAMEQREMELQVMLQKEKMQKDFDLQKEKLDIERINAENTKIKLTKDLEQIRLMKMEFEYKLQQHHQIPAPDIH
ncbi:hypothetical protein G9A89_020822 [Geosiphon pyriformis]|nr:hypothetical protein G9A89_020822 [Geosiphon pyriformis]